MLGLVFAYFGIGLLLRLAPADLPRMTSVSMDPTVLAFAIGTLLGAAAQFLIQWPVLRREGFHYRPLMNLHDPALQRVLVKGIAGGLIRSAHDCAEGGLAVTLANPRPGEPRSGASYRSVPIRDARVKAMYEFTCNLATLDPPPPETQQLFAAIYGNRTAMDAFVQMNAGTISPAEFFAPENVNAIMAA